MRFLVELTLRNPADGTVVVERITERSSYTSSITDDPPNAWYRPCGQRLANYDESLFGAGQSFGKAGIGRSELLLSNADRSWDKYETWVWDRVRILIGPSGRRVSLTAFAAVWDGPVDAREYDGSTVTVRLRATSADWDVPIPRRAYLGTNAGPLGLEGNADLAGVLAPLVLGTALNVTPKWVNPSLLIGQAHDGPANFLQVYRRAELVRADLSGAWDGHVGAAIEDPGYAWPSGANVIFDLSRSLFRLRNGPATAVTCDIRTGVDNPVAQLNALLGFESDGAWPEFTGGQVGWVPEEGDTAAAVLDVLAATVGGYWWIDIPGGLSIIKMPSLNDVAPHHLSPTDGRYSVISAQDSWGEAPLWSITVRTDRNWTPMATADIADTVTDLGPFTASWRQTPTRADASIKATWPRSQTLTVDTALVGGDAPIDALWALYSVPRRRWQVTGVAASTCAGWPLGALIAVQRTKAEPAINMILTRRTTESGRVYTLELFG